MEKEIRYYPNGAIASIADVKNGNLHGLCTKFYHNGNISEELHYDNGEIHGECKFYVCGFMKSKSYAIQGELGRYHKYYKFKSLLLDSHEINL
jgi:antitoxin component YwqK of YwqJK toxin-antitoxin module